MFLFYLLVGVAILLLLYALARVIVQARPAQLVTVLRWVAVIGGGAAATWLVVSGRLGQALMLGAVLAPLFARWKALFDSFRNAGGPSPGQTSDVETAWLRMSLDHDSGAMDGTVLQGAWKGRRLGELAPDALLELLVECRVHDSEAAQLLEAYLDRVHPDWRAAGSAAGDQAESPGARRPTAPAGMTRDEAARILGVEPGAGAAAVREAHRRLVMKLHPDVGGSSYLAAKINQAKDVLLGS